ncbi:MAG: indole-3-glycerol phosphate synthase TrpC [Candidatus Omnitrophica bacterium]|nr:indole-3-glycerol phosphate synthase TrpC [Candidatus Omnitrophota bacterium]MCM8799385.1 indole-3-glycerol phosphate synthase TrpC [Candidatus Omnitrophota bacterium]
MLNDFLKEVIERKKEKIVERKKIFPLEVLKEKIEISSFSKGLFIKSITKRNDLSLIAEIKKASPSKGILRENFSILDIASIYKESGASALSVLTEEDFFMGDLSYISLIKEKINIPILRKDFIIEPYQIYESKAFGADAVLLIAEIFSKMLISEFLDLIDSLCLDCLVEVNNEKDLKKVLSIKKTKLIGINNRNLHTLEVDFKTTERLFPLIPKEKLVVVESGIKRPQDILFLKILGVNAVLIGEAFMEAEDIKSKIKEIMGW